MRIVTTFKNGFKATKTFIGEHKVGFAVGVSAAIAAVGVVVGIKKPGKSEENAAPSENDTPSEE